MDSVDAQNLRLIMDTAFGEVNNQSAINRQEECGVLAKFKKGFGAVGRFVSKVHLSICDASWIFFMILAMSYGPIVFETERQRQIQKFESKKSSNENNES